jgi:hypothetical protein
MVGYAIFHVTFRDYNLVYIKACEVAVKRLALGFALIPVK